MLLADCRVPIAASLLLKLYAVYRVWGIGSRDWHWQNPFIEIRRFQGEA
jgi:hypothetical protein